MSGTSPKINVPADIRKVLAGHSEARVKWNGLTPIARRDFISWVVSAKQQETRKRRAESIPSRLLSGKRRPCCYAIVPMNLYTALNANAKAKAAWKVLAPDARRDLVGWIAETNNPNVRERRIKSVCTKLAFGKPRPSS